MDILYVDGESLKSSVSSFGETYGVDVSSFDYGSFFGGIGGSGRVFFYDGWPSKKPAETDKDFEDRWNEKKHFFSKLQSIERLFLKDGTTKWTKGRGSEQKGVDVLLAVDVIAHTLKEVTGHVSILTSDLDFYPVLKALQETQVRSRLIFDPRKTSPDLLVEADELAPLWPYYLRRGLPAPARAAFENPAPMNGELTDAERASSGIAVRDGMEWALLKKPDGQFMVYCNSQRSFGITEEQAIERMVAPNGYAFWLLEELKADLASKGNVQPA